MSLPRLELKNLRLKRLRCKPYSESLRLKLILTLLNILLTRKMFLKFLVLPILDLVKACPQVWPRWNLLSKCARRELSKTLCHQLLMRPVSLLEESSWKSKRSENGTRERRTFEDFRTSASTCCNQPSLKEKKKLKKDMPRELKKSDSRKLKIRKELSLRFKERESRFSERCTRPVKTSRSRAKREISSRTMLTLALQSMPQLLEMAFLLIRKLTNMKFSPRLFHHIRVSKNSADLCLTTSSNRRSVYRNSTLNSPTIFPGVKLAIWHNSRKPKNRLMRQSKPKKQPPRIEMAKMTILWNNSLR